jgi:hypothetical protein
MFVIACDNDDDKKEEKGVLTISGTLPKTVASAFIIEDGINGVVKGIDDYFKTEIDTDYVTTNATNLQAIAGGLTSEAAMTALSSLLTPFQQSIWNALAPLIKAQSDTGGTNSKLNMLAMVDGELSDDTYTTTKNDVAVGLMFADSTQFGFGGVNVKNGNATVTWASSPEELPTDGSLQSVDSIKDWLSEHATSTNQIDFQTIIANIYILDAMAAQQQQPST